MPNNSKLARHLAVAAAASASIASAAPAPSPTPQRAAQEQPAAQYRHLIFFLDPASLSQDELDRATAALDRFTQVQMRPNDRVALMIAAGGGVRIIQDFTADPAALQKALQQVDTATPPPPGSFADSLQKVLAMLKPLGMKSAVVYVTNGAAIDRDRLNSLINDAIKANVAFYPIDVRGLQGRVQK